MFESKSYMKPSQLLTPLLLCLHLSANLIGFTSSNAYAEERLCPDGKRSYFGVCPEEGDNSRPLQSEPPSAKPPTTPSISDSIDVRWRLASGFPKSLDMIFGASTHFAKDVSDRTNGKFMISLHSAGELTRPSEVLDAVQADSIEMGHIISNDYYIKDPAWTMGGWQLFGVNSSPTDSWLTSNEGRQEFSRFTEAHNIMSFPLGTMSGNVTASNTNNYVSTIIGWWCRKPISRLTDLKGLKVRLEGSESIIWSKLGVIPVKIPAGMIYPALEKGEIDCASHIGPHDDIKYGLYKVAPIFMTFNSNINARSSIQTHLIINANAWRKLPEKYQKAIQDASSETQIWLQEKSLYANAYAFKLLIDYGAKTMVMPKEVTAALKNTALNEYEDQAAKSPEFSRLYRAWQKANTR